MATYGFLAEWVAIARNKRVDFTYNALGQYATVSRYNALTNGTANMVAVTSYTYDAAEPGVPGLPAP